MNCTAFARSVAAVAVLALATSPAAAQERGWLGVGFGLSEAGTGKVSVDHVFPESPASRAEIHQGDTVVRINGRPVTKDMMVDLAEKLEPGDTIRLRILRGDRESDRLLVAGTRRQREVMIVGLDGTRVLDIDSVRRHIRIRMDTMNLHMDSLRVHMDSLRKRMHLRPSVRVIGRAKLDAMRERDRLEDVLEQRIILDEEGMRVGEKRVQRVMPFVMELGRRTLGGAELAEVNPGLARYFSTREGLLVLRVAPATPTARSGLEAGDVIVRVAGQPVRAVGDLRRVLSGVPAGEVKMEVVRQGSRRELKMPWTPDSLLAPLPPRPPRAPRAPRPARAPRAPAPSAVPAAPTPPATPPAPPEPPQR